MGFTSIDALLQISLVKDYIAAYQRSSPTPIFRTVAILAKGIEILAYKTLRTANEALSKRRRAKRI